MGRAGSLLEDPLEVAGEDASGFEDLGSQPLEALAVLRAPCICLLVMIMTVILPAIAVEELTLTHRLPFYPFI